MDIITKVLKAEKTNKRTDITRLFVGMWKWAVIRALLHFTQKLKSTEHFPFEEVLV